MPVSNETCWSSASTTRAGADPCIRQEPLGRPTAATVRPRRRIALTTTDARGARRPRGHRRPGRGRRGRLARAAHRWTSPPAARLPPRVRRDLQRGGARAEVFSSDRTGRTELSPLAARAPRETDLRRPQGGPVDHAPLAVTPFTRPDLGAPAVHGLLGGGDVGRVT